MEDITETVATSLGDTTPPTMYEITGLMKLTTLPVYYKYFRYVGAMEFYKTMIEIGELINQIYSMECENVGNYYVMSQHGLHFNTCPWGNNRHDKDVVDMCVCTRINHATEKCIELLNTLGL